MILRGSLRQKDVERKWEVGIQIDRSGVWLREGFVEGSFDGCRPGVSKFWEGFHDG